MKPCIIEQSCGLGDILMSLKVASRYYQAGHPVIWPVEPIYANLKNNIKLDFPIEFPCVREEFALKERYQELARTEISEVTEFEDVLYVPLRRSVYSNYGQQLSQKRSSDASNMLSKFGMCDTTFEEWQNSWELNRNQKKEEQLNHILNISPTEDVHIVNNRFGTPPQWNEFLARTIETPSNMRRIQMSIIPPFDVFDWSALFERAKKIDTVSTSTFFLFEKLDLQCVPTIYSRNHQDRSFEENFGWMKEISQKEYNFII